MKMTILQENLSSSTNEIQEFYIHQTNLTFEKLGLVIGVVFTYYPYLYATTQRQ